MTFRLMRIQLIFLGCCFFLIGCGGDGAKLVPAGGTVKYKGEPVSNASVSFIFGDGQLAVGTTDTAGKFTLSTGARVGAPIGAAKVVVSKAAGMAGVDSSKQMTPRDMAEMMKGKKGAEMKVEANKKGELPTKYASPDTSGLTKTVSASPPNDFAIDLED